MRSCQWRCVTHPGLWCAEVDTCCCCCPAANDVQCLPAVPQAGQRSWAPAGTAAGAAGALDTAARAAWHVLKKMLIHHKLHCGIAATVATTPTVSIDVHQHKIKAASRPHVAAAILKSDIPRGAAGPDSCLMSPHAGPWWWCASCCCCIIKALQFRTQGCPSWSVCCEHVQSTTAAMHGPISSRAATWLDALHLSYQALQVPVTHVVGLWYIAGQAVVLPEESQQLAAGPVVSKLLRALLLSIKHALHTGGYICTHTATIRGQSCLPA